MRRAYLIGAGGRVQAERRSDDGASRLLKADFEPALRALAADWLRPGLPVLACGMVGSAHGWREAPYMNCPARPHDLAGALAVVQAGDVSVHIVPGLRQRSGDGLPDVIRGEETQLVGLLSQQPELACAATVLMPGTHSKWVHVVDDAIQGFSTRMTGELYALLRTHSVLGRLMAPDAAFDAGAFDQGVAAARAGAPPTWGAGCSRCGRRD